MPAHPHASRVPGLGCMLAGLCAFAVLLAGCAPPDPVSEARDLQAAGRFQDSLEPLREMVEAKTDDPEVHYLYGVALTATGSPSLAVWPLRKAMESPDWLVPAGLQLAAGALATWNSDLAIEIADRVLEAEPDNVRALLIRSQAKVNTRRDYEGALADAERAIELDPDTLEALVPRAVALLGLERVEEAAVALDELEQRVAEEGPSLEGSATFCAARASFLKEKGELEAADRVYGECLEKFPAHFTLVEDAVEFYDARGEVERANDIVRGALEEAPGARAYRVSLAMRLEALGDPDGALEVLRAATEVENPVEAATAWHDLAGYYVDHEEFDAAVQAYQEVMERMPEPSPQVRFAHAEALLLAGRHAEALALAEESEVAAHRALIQGRVRLDEGDAAQALEHLTEGLRLWPDNAVARYYAALAAEGSGDFDRAVEEYRYSVRVDPGATDARLRLGRLQVAQGRPDLALTALRHDIEGHPPSIEMVMLELEVLGRLGRPQEAGAPHLSSRTLVPQLRGRAVAALARGTRERSGAAAAAELIESAEQLDLTAAMNAAALRELVIDLVEADRAADALPRARAAVEAKPELAVFHEIHGLALERGGAGAEARAAYERALELEPGHAGVLSGLARLARAEGRDEEALGLFERAAAAAPDDAAAVLGAADALAALGRSVEAESRLEALLARQPLDAQAALRLAQLRAERGEGDARTQALARRAARFGEREEAEALLVRLRAPAAAGAPAAQPPG